MKLTVKMDSKNLMNMLESQEKRGRDLSKVMRGIAQDMETRKDLTFKNQKDPEGKPWSPLSQTTINIRRNRKKSPTTSEKPLQDTGQLRASFSVRHTRRTASIGSNLKYAATQQYGLTKGYRRRGKRLIPWGDVPARRMVAITPKQSVGYKRRINNWILKGELTTD